MRTAHLLVRYDFSSLGRRSVNCPWPLDWQRHYRVLADLAADEPGGALPAIEPGVLFEGDDLGKWLQRQASSWAQLSEEQQHRLSELGVTPAAAHPGPSGQGCREDVGEGVSGFPARNPGSRSVRRP
ncbi:helicase associated domain-containing protein [Streptomyces sp. NPDC056982]|uniref:helicase associated domain-containing protein n=1 Tax=unclassified Streptomyces TaxID=2593676 RepID=UPI00363D4306